MRGEVNKSGRERERGRGEGEGERGATHATLLLSFRANDAWRQSRSRPTPPSRRSRAGLEPSPRQLRPPHELTIGDPFLAIEHQEPARLGEGGIWRLKSRRNPPILISSVADARLCRLSAS